MWNFIPFLLKFINIKNVKSGLLVILGILLLASVYVNWNQYDKNSNLQETVKSQQELITNYELNLNSCNTKFNILKEDFEKLRIKSKDNELELSRVQNQLLIELNKKEQESLINWETMNFTEDCDKDIQQLKDHAIKVSNELRNKR